MPRFLPDTSCLVAALCSWHEHHERALRELDARLSRGEALVIAAPALVEAYAVLTRLPLPHRLSPADARALLQANFLEEDLELVALDVGSYRELLQTAPERGIAGGRTYDAVILECAVAARADVLLTFNERHFRPHAPPGLAIVVPS